MADALPAFPPAETIANLNAEARTSAVDAWVRAGHSLENARVAFGVAAPQQTTPAVPDAVQREMNRTGATAREIQALAHHLVVQNPAMLAEVQKLGIDPTRPDPQRLELKDVERDPSLMLAGANSPDGYRLNFGDNAKMVELGDLAAVNSEFQQTYFEGGIPPHMAQPLLEAQLKSMNDLPPIGPAREEWHADQRAMLGKVGDPEELLLLASLPIGRMNEVTRNEWFSRGALSAAPVIVQLAAIGRVILAREKGK